MKFFYISIYFIGLFSTTISADFNLDDMKDTVTSMGKDAQNGIQDALEHGKKVILINMKKEKYKKRPFEQIWTDVVDEFNEGSALVKKLKSAPKSAWLHEDKVSIQEDINDVLDKIIKILLDNNFISYRETVNSLNNKISKLKLDIIEYREKKVGAPLKSMIYTTQDGYDEKIKNTKDEINIYTNDINIVQNNLKKYFSDIGVNLTEEQIDVLLTKVDGDDIIQLTLVLEVLKQITNQLMMILQDSGEELEHAKKYYAMHLISIELVVHMYQKYIDKVDNIYLPKLNKIMDEAENMVKKTKSSRDRDRDTGHKAIYNKNIEAQTLTLKASRLYMQYLMDGKKRIIEAQKISKNNLELARNTYNTVSLSAELYAVMLDSKKIFNKLMEIQIPDILPFENLQMKSKYKELTIMLQDGTDN